MHGRVVKLREIADWRPQHPACDQRVERRVAQQCRSPPEESRVDGTNLVAQPRRLDQIADGEKQDIHEEEAVAPTIACYSIKCHPCPVQRAAMDDLK